MSVMREHSLLVHGGRCTNATGGGGGGCHLRVVPPGQLLRRPSTPKPFIEPGFVIFFDVKFFVFAFR